MFFMLPWKLSYDPAHVFLLHCPGPDLLLHLPGLLRVAAEQQQSGRQSVQTVDGPEILQTVFLGQDEHYCVVAVAAARVNLENELWNSFRIYDPYF